MARKKEVCETPCTNRRDSILTILDSAGPQQPSSTAHARKYTEKAVYEVADLSVDCRALVSPGP